MKTTEYFKHARRRSDRSRISENVLSSKSRIGPVMSDIVFDFSVKPAERGEGHHSISPDYNEPPEPVSHARQACFSTGGTDTVLKY